MEQRTRFPSETDGEHTTGTNDRKRRRRASQPLARVATAADSVETSQGTAERTAEERRQSIFERLHERQTARTGDGLRPETIPLTMNESGYRTEVLHNPDEDARRAEQGDRPLDRPEAVDPERTVELVRQPARFHEDPATDPQRRNQEYSQWASHDELAANELNASEGVIELNAPVVADEHEIPLYEQTLEAAPETLPEEPDAIEDAAQDSRIRPRSVPLAEVPHANETQPIMPVVRPDVIARQTPAAMYEAQATTEQERQYAPVVPELVETRARPLAINEMEPGRRWVSQLPPELISAAEATVAPVAETPAAPQTGPNRPVTRRELDSEVWRANVQGMSSGLFFGGLLAWHEHRKHRRNEKRLQKHNELLERKTEQQTKQLNDARAQYDTYRLAAAEQARRQSGTERQLHTVQTQLDVQRTAASSAQERPASAKEVRDPMNFPLRYDGAAKQNAAPERYAMPVQAYAERSTKGGAKEITPVREGELVIPPEHRLVTEGAFAAEIDRATGKLVEKPSFEHGNEYYREKAKEGMPDPQRTVATGEVALAAAMGKVNAKGQKDRSGAGAGSGGGAAPSNAASAAARAASIPNATTQGAPKSAQQDGPRHSSDNADQRPLWPLLLALAIVAICLIWAL